MTPATAPRSRASDARLLVVDVGRSAVRDAWVTDVARLLEPGDVFVVNDAATLPASLRGRTIGGEAVEARLTGPPEDGLWGAVLLGAGSWRDRTEDRPVPPRVVAGERLEFEIQGTASTSRAPRARLSVEKRVDAGLTARVVAVSPLSPRLVTLRFDREGAELWDLLYRAGRPVQYSYLHSALELWDVNTSFASRPWAAEPPSTGLALDAGLIASLRARGIVVARITEAAGLSSTGDPAIDAALPLPERFDVPEKTVREIALARARGGRVIAAGTTVVRALEGAAAASSDGRLAPRTGITDVRLGPDVRPAIVDGILTGLHEPGTSHYELMRSFVPDRLLDESVRHAEAAGYLGHEFGDLCLVLPVRAERERPTRAVEWMSDRLVEALATSGAISARR